jgi:hypothetical protein
MDARVDFSASLGQKKIYLQIVYETACWLAFLMATLTLLTGCVSIPLSSNTTVNDKLQSLETLQPGDVLVVYGENAPRPKEAFTDYFSAFCLRAYGNRNTIAYLIATILKVNPQPGRFAVKHLDDVKQDLPRVIEDGPDCVEGSILCKLGLPKAKVSADHLRYAIHVREEFQPKLHVPLYAAPFGIASCSHKTVIEADVWELSTDKYIGSFTVSAEGELTVAAWLFHLAVVRDTQNDATKKLAREIVERFTGLKPLEVD